MNLSKTVNCLGTLYLVLFYHPAFCFCDSLGSIQPISRLNPMALQELVREGQGKDFQAEWNDTAWATLVLPC